MTSLIHRALRDMDTMTDQGLTIDNAAKIAANRHKLRESIHIPGHKLKNPQIILDAEGLAVAYRERCLRVWGVPVKGSNDYDLDSSACNL